MRSRRILGGRIGRPTLAIAAVLGCWAVAASSGPTVRAGDGPLVRIDNFSFDPEGLTVPEGSTVTWRNDDDIPHLVVLSDHSFRSKALDTNDSAAFTVTKPGETTYFCGLHPQMKGKITVVPRG